MQPQSVANNRISDVLLACHSYRAVLSWHQQAKVEHRYFDRARAGANLEGMLLCLHLMLLGYVSSSGLLGRSMGCAPFSVLAVQVTESET